MTGNESNDGKRIDTLPSNAYRLGVDQSGREHYHSAFEGRVWVFRDGNLVHEQDLEGRSVVSWVEFIVDEHGGWQTRQPVEETNGFRGLARDILEKLDDQEASA